MAVCLGCMCILGNLQLSARKNENGIAIGPILFVVAILGLLAAAIAAGSGSFTGSTSKDSARAMAEAILDIGRQVKTSAELVSVSNGCSIEQTSFENPVVSGYTNSSAPADKSCHVFDVAGGKILWPQIPQAAIDLSFASSDPVRGQALFVNQWVTGKDDSASALSGCWSGTPPYCTPFLMIIPYVKKEVCTAINDLVKISNPSGDPPPMKWNGYGGSGVKWVGSNPIGTKWTTDSVEDRLLREGCTEGVGPTAGKYFYFQILLWQGSAR